MATTLRGATTATLNDWGAICWADGMFFEAPKRKNLEIYDRVGGGDSFASGLIYGLLTGRGPAVGRRMRRRARRTRHDDARRHEHGDVRRDRARDEGRNGEGQQVDEVGPRAEGGRGIGLGFGDGVTTVRGTSS